MLDAFMYSSMHNFDYDRRLREMAMKHLDISFTDRKEEEGYGLKGAILFEEEGRHYLRLHYKKENGDDLYIPKLSLPIDRIPIFEEDGTYTCLFGTKCLEKTYAVWGNIRLEAEKGIITVPDNNGNPVETPSSCYYVVVRPKKKMTKKELEEALGYEIEIVEEE